MQFVALGLFGNGVLEYFLGLRITSISHVNFGLSDWVNIMRVDHASAALREISQKRGITGIYRAASSVAKHRIGLEPAGSQYTALKTIQATFAFVAH